MARNQVTPLEKREWAHNPATQDFLTHLKETRSETMETWANRGFVGNDINETMNANSRALGSVDVIQQLIAMIEEMGRE